MIQHKFLITNPGEITMRQLNQNEISAVSGGIAESAGKDIFVVISVIISVATYVYCVFKLAAWVKNK